MNDGTASGPALTGHGSAATGMRHSRDATWAMWLGVGGLAFGFLLMFAVLTPAAIFYGIRALRAIRVDPDLQGRSRAWTGMTLAVVAPLLWVGVFVAFLVDGIG